jgi:uncharacterized membrane protein YcgQ (UPF0703/DUF1980 family)
MLRPRLHPRIHWTIWLVTIMCVSLLLTPALVQARPPKTTIYQVILDADHYSGKTVTVEGLVKTLKLESTKKGKHYSTFELTADQAPVAILVVAHRRLAIHENDYVRVTGRFQKKKDLPCCWDNTIVALRVCEVDRNPCK